MPIREFDSGMTDSGSIQEYTKLDVGFTDVGVQVWCRRCEKMFVTLTLKIMTWKQTSDA